MMAVWDDDKKPDDRFREAVVPNERRILIMVPLTKIWNWLKRRKKNGNSVQSDS